MKNALDEIKCVPVLGGKKPPYRITSHPYCVDIVTTYVQISKFDFKNKEEYLKRIEDSIKDYCLSNKINFAFHFDNKLPLTIPPAINNFQWFLGLQIIGFDINKIKALLSFQQKQYLDEEVDYITFVEFAVYNIVKGFTLIDNTERLRMVMEWVNEQRVLILSSNKQEIDLKEATITNKQEIYPDEIKLTGTKKKEKVEKTKIVAPSFSLIGFKKDSDYFVTNANDLMEAFKLLKGGGFIQTDTNYEWYKAIFNGEVIKRENRIEWTGKIKDLNRFVVFLMNGKVESLRNKWETTCNCFFNTSVDISPENLRKANGKNDNEEKLKEIVQKL